jgi:hypothetical protein
VPLSGGPGAEPEGAEPDQRLGHGQRPLPCNSLAGDHEKQPAAPHDPPQPAGGTPVQACRRRGTQPEPAAVARPKTVATARRSATSGPDAQHPAGGGEGQRFEARQRRRQVAAQPVGDADPGG